MRRESFVDLEPRNLLKNEDAFFRTENEAQIFWLPPDIIPNIIGRDFFWISGS